MPRFRLTGGIHNEPVLNDKGEQVFLPDGRKAETPYKRGDVFDSPKPLDEMFNSRGYPPKFERVHDTDEEKRRIAGMIEQANAAAEANSRSMTRALDRMSAKSLQEFAAEEEINLDGLTNRDEILAKIKAAKGLDRQVAKVA